MKTVNNGLYASTGIKRSRYRCVARRSHVDETLFGKNNSCYPSEANTRNDNDASKILLPCPDKLAQNNWLATENRKYMVKAGPMILYQSTGEAHQFPLILPYQDFAQLKEKSSHKQGETLQYLVDREKAKEQDEAACAARKAEMRMYDMRRIRNEPLSMIEEEARMKAEGILRKAYEQRLETDTEIQEVNMRINMAKTNAILAAQVEEKAMIKKAYEEEEKRLDKMVEKERLVAISIDEELHRAKLEQERYSAAYLLHQIKEREELRLIELERRNQENQQIKAAWARDMEAIIQEKVAKRGRDAMHLAELMAENEDLITRKKMEAERDRLIDTKLVREQAEKIRHAEEHEKEQMAIKILKVKCQSKLKEENARQMDSKEAKDQLRAKRAMEAAERKWRNEEKEQWQKKCELKETVKKSLAEQLELRNRQWALQTLRDKEDYVKILSALKMNLDLERRQREGVEAKGKKYREDLIRQIKEKEQQLVDQRVEHFQEGERMQEQIRLRAHRLNTVKEKKLAALRESGIPESCLQQVLSHFPDTSS